MKSCFLNVTDIYINIYICNDNNNNNNFILLLIIWHELNIS